MNNTRTEITSTISLTEEDKIRNVKYMIIQLHFHSIVVFYTKDNQKYCKFKIQNSNEWTIEYDLPLMYCFDYREIYEKGNGEEYEYYHAILKDLKLILLSNEEDEWFLTLFDNIDQESKDKILLIKNSIFKEVNENIREEIGDLNIKNLIFLLSEI